MRNTVVPAAAFVASMLGAVLPAHAVLQIAGNIGGTTFTCVDNDLSCDTAAATGVLQLSDQTINGVIVNSSVQTATVNASQNILDTSSLSLINVSGADRTIVFTVSATDFVGPVSGFSTSGAGTWENAIGSDIALGWFNSAANVQGAAFAGDTPGLQVDSFSDTAGLVTDAFAHSNAGPASDPNLFSMTLNASGTLIGRVAGCDVATGQGCPALVSRGQSEVKERIAVPEPGSLLLLGAALLGFVGLRRGPPLSS